MASVTLIAVAYGVLVLAGGVIGYTATGSVPSIIAGAGFGMALLGSAYAMWRGSRMGWYGAIALATILAAYFALRYSIGVARMPAGALAVVSTGAAGLLALLGWERRTV